MPILVDPTPRINPSCLRIIDVSKPPMITVTRLNGKPIVINADMIRSVEANPDTMIKLINGDTVIVQESMPEIVTRCIDYGRHLRRMVPPS